MRPSLLAWIWRQNWPWLTVAVPIVVATGYVLLAWQPLRATDDWPVMFAVVHAAALAWLAGRFRGSAAAFLHTRGATRGTLWRHTMLACGVAVLMVWLPAAMVVWTPLRSLVQDRIFQSPYFPLMAPTEATAPLAWLALYVLVFPAVYYARVRSMQPTRSPLTGWLVAAAAIFVAWVAYLALEMALNLGRAGWLAGIEMAAGAIAAIALLVGSRSLHRTLEVRS